MSIDSRWVRETCNSFFFLIFFVLSLKKLQLIQKLFDVE